MTSSESDKKSNRSFLRQWSSFLGILISLILVIYLAMKYDWEGVWRSIRKADPATVIFACLLQAAAWWTRSLRWVVLLFPIGKIHPGSALSATAMGNLFNNILPVRMGELVRARVLALREGFSTTSTLSTLVVEKLMESMSLLILFFLLLFPVLDAAFLKSAFGGGERIIWFGGVLMTLFSGLLVVFVQIQKEKNRDRVIDFFTRLLPFATKEFIRSVSSKIIVGLEIRSGWFNFYKVAFLSFLIWFIHGFRAFVVFEALGLDISVSYSFLTVIVLALTLTLPAAPGFWGNFHIAVIFMLGFQGVSDNSAAAAAILLHAVQFVVSSLIGIVYALNYQRTPGAYKSVFSGASTISGSQKDI